MTIIYDVTLEIVLRKDILDPAGRTVEHSLHAQGFMVNEVRIGKIVTLALEAENEQAARNQVSKMADKLLCNTVMEDYTIRLSAR